MKFILKSHLPVIWTSNRQAWVTQQIISEWYSKQFAIVCYNFAIKTVCHEILLLLDNAPGHLPDLEDTRIKSQLEVNVVVLPSNTTSLLQPMDQGVMAAFNACYLRQSLQEIIIQMDTSGVSLKEYRKDYNISDD
jgi:hypothetical protein